MVIPRRSKPASFAVDRLVSTGRWPSCDRARWTIVVGVSGGSKHTVPKVDLHWQTLFEQRGHLGGAILVRSCSQLPKKAKRIALLQRHCNVHRLECSADMAAEKILRRAG